MKSATLNKMLKKGLIATSILVASSFSATTLANERIAFFVSDLSNVFHQSQATEAKRYAKEKYGAEVVIFDGKADSAVMTPPKQAKSRFADCAIRLLQRRNVFVQLVLPR